MALLLGYVLYLVFVCYLFTLPPSAANENVQGDKTVGGLHFFEVHAPNGGTGVGIKILIALAIIALAVFCYYKWKQFKKRLATYATQTALTTVATAAPQISQAAGLLPAPAAQQFPMAMYTPCHLKHKQECHRCESPIQESARLP